MGTWKSNLSKYILTPEQAAEAKLYWGLSLTKESLIIARLADSVIHLYQQLEKNESSLDIDAIAKAINYELDWIDYENCYYAADSVIKSIKRSQE